MPTTLRLYRGDAETFDADGPDSDGPAVALAGDRPAAAPRVLPFPGRAASRDGRDETGRLDVTAPDGGAATIRFHAPHLSADDAGMTDVAEDDGDVLPLAAILSLPTARGYRTSDAPAADRSPAVAGRIGGWASSPAGLPGDGPLSRAKVLHANRTCKACGAGGVEPVLLTDGVTDAAGDPVPGSGTLVGFHCCRCAAEWPVA